jgi:DNA gyrase inhibitor GyrI
MASIKVEEVNIKEPLVVVGKMFQGDYAKSQQYITEVQQLLVDAAVQFLPNKVMGVYYDNPNEKKAEELKSFQGLFVSAPNVNLPKGVQKLELKGDYIYVKATGDIMKAIHEGYGALFNYISENKITLKSPAGYQVSTFSNDTMVTEIYMELQ